MTIFRSLELTSILKFFRIFKNRDKLNFKSFVCRFVGSLFKIDANFSTKIIIKCIKKQLLLFELERISKISYHFSDSFKVKCPKVVSNIHTRNFHFHAIFYLFIGGSTLECPIWSWVCTHWSDSL